MGANSMNPNPPAQSANPNPRLSPPRKVIVDVRESGSNADATNTPIISADIDAGTSGITLKSDVLGSDFVDASVGLGAVNGAVGTVLGLTDCSGSNSDATQAAIISADLDAGTSGIKLMTDVLGSDFVDASVGFGAVDGVLDTVLGLTDTGTGLLDGLLCDIV